MERDIILILGNPGTGKSSITNCLAGKAIFKAGLSFGGGMTTVLNEEDWNGITYMDVPGLCDPELEEAAAKAITEALQKTGKYRIFFMVRQSNGRVILEDISTVQRVMDCIHVGDKPPFSVIVNNIEKEIMAVLDKTSPDFNVENHTKFLATILGGIHKPSDVFLLETIQQLKGASNVVVVLPPLFQNFVKNAPSLVIPDKENITAISTDAEGKRLLMDALKAMAKQMESAENAQKALAVASLTTAKDEVNRLKNAYGNGVSVKFVITNASKHTMAIHLVNIDHGKAKNDPLVKFPSWIPPFTSAAGFHAKSNAAAVGSAGYMEYSIGGKVARITWAQPYSGKLSSSGVVGDGFKIDVANEDVNLGTSTIFIKVEDGP